MKLVGSYYLLSVLPIWATALILYMVTMGVLFVLRDRCEGLYYNTSYSAMLGDGALVGIVLMAAGILQRGAFPPSWLQGGYFHLLAVLVGIIVGVFWVMIDDPKQWGDTYHHLGIAPLMVYLGLTLLPVIYINGTGVEKVATVCLILLWAGLVVYDGTTNPNRLKQRKYFNLGSHLDAIRDLKNYPICPRRR